MTNESYEVADNPKERNIYEDEVPMALCMVNSVSKARNDRKFVVLFDSGSSHTWWNIKSLPKGCVPRKVEASSSATLNGNMSSNLEVDVQDVTFPEFFKTRRLHKIEARVFTAPCSYDAIIGRDVLRDMGLKLDFKLNKMSWDECHVPFKTFNRKLSNRWGIKEPELAEQLYLNLLEADLEDDDTLPTCDMTDCSDNDEFFEDSDDLGDDQAEEGNDGDDMYVEINQSKYETADVDKVVRSCTHLTQNQQNDLRGVLEKYPKLFDDTLGTYPDEKIHLDLKDDAVPHCQPRAYGVPHAHRSVFKAELDRLERIGVVEKTGRSEWIAGTFIVPKKLLPGETVPRVRWVSDFRGLNKCLKRKVYPIPRIGDILARRTGYQFLTKMDISMQFYTFELDDESKDLCTIATPFGLYRYKKLPMGICQSPDIAQEVMEKVVKDICDDIEVYIDDIGIFSKDWTSHIDVLDKVCSRLQSKGFSVNILKCEFGVKESDFLGHWLTPTGVKPLRKKIQGILDMQKPTDIGQLRSFLGLVTYYRDMWPRRSHILAPLTELIGTKEYVWGERQQKAFLQMKAVIAKDTLLAYPDHNLPFLIETDASDYQLGGRIFQMQMDEKTGKTVPRDIAFYTRKLNSAQKNYSTIEKELLSIVETFKAFRDTIFGGRIKVYTDHKNLTYKLSQFATQRVTRWRLLLEEYGPEFFYKPGPENVIGDALSRVPTTRSVRESPDDKPELLSKSETYCMFEEHPDVAELLLNDPEISDCFLEHPVFDEDGRLPFQFKTLEEYQMRSEELQSLPEVFPDRFSSQSFGDAELICFHQNGEDKIVLTHELLPKVVKYYHEAMSHAEGEGRLVQTIKRHYWHRDIDKAVKQHIEACDTCARKKRGGKVYGESGPRDASVLPWQQVHCDSIGPWKIDLRGRTLTFHAMTMIDACTNLLEIKHTYSTTAAEGASAVENTWLARYPRPVKIVTDQGPEFGNEFTEMCDSNGITHSTSTSRNPQGNSLIEAIHKTIGQVLRTVVAAKNPQSKIEGERVIEETLATAMHACRCACSSSLGYNSPGALAFSRDMFLDIPLYADILALKNNRQLLVDRRLLRENAKRIRHDYAVGDQVWKKMYLGFSDKLKDTVEGPYPISQVHTNGTVTIRLNPNQTERINIRRIKPRYKSKVPTLPSIAELPHGEGE